MTFVVYTYFGRVLATFKVGTRETHHKVMSQAREFLVSYEKETGKQAWVKINKHKES